MGPDPVERFLATLRSAVPNAEVVFTEGNCFKLYLLLREVFPQAVPFYSGIRGHVYTMIDGKLYDIYGKQYQTTINKNWGIGPVYYLPAERRVFKEAFRWQYRPIEEKRPCVRSWVRNTINTWVTKVSSVKRKSCSIPTTKNREGLTLPFIPQ